MIMNGRSIKDKEKRDADSNINNLKIDKEQKRKASR